jgi:choline-glycine betaine transporter
MKELIKKENIKLTISALVYLILGVMFCVGLNRMVDFAESTISFVFLVIGAIFVLIYGLLPSDGKVYKVLVYGIIMLGLGLLMVFYRKFFIIALAVMIAYGGVVSIMDAINKKKENTPWVPECVVGVVVVALAVMVIILSGTNAAKNIIALFMGATFLIEAAIEIIALVKIVKAAKPKVKDNVEVVEATEENTAIEEVKTGNESQAEQQTNEQNEQ